MKTAGKIGLAVALAVTIAATVIGFSNYRLYQETVKENAELKNQVSVLTKEEERAIIMQHVNAQMEEIANQQRRISDEQRVEAIEQKHVAEEMRHHAEAEQQKALLAQQQAEQAGQLAQQQRILAEQQRSEAEYSKRITDTLSYIILARQLGNAAVGQRLTGHQELSDMLAYTSILYTTRYHGDIYHPSIYQALMEASQGQRSWNRHKGATNSIEFLPENGDYFTTASSYGEVYMHHLNGDNLQSTLLFSNSNYDFRDIYEISNGDFYVVSRDGQVIVINKTGHVQATLTPNTKDHLLGVTPLGNELVVIGEHTLTFVNTQNRSVRQTVPVPYRIVYFSRYDYCPIVFDDQGKMHIVRAATNIETKPVPHKGQVTAFASSKTTKLTAYGMKDGTIWLEKGGNSIQLTGHRSRITKIKINGWRLYSSSFDGSLNLWMTDQGKVEPIKMFTTNSWILDFTFDNQKNTIWAGDYKGNLKQASISVPIMAKRLKDKLTRNFTRDEWNYFIGNKVPYETILGKEIKL